MRQQTADRGLGRDRVRTRHLEKQLLDASQPADSSPLIGALQGRCRVGITVGKSAATPRTNKFLESSISRMAKSMPLS